LRSSNETSQGGGQLMRLLIVNNQDDVRACLQTILQEGGHPAPLFANSYPEAVAVLAPEPARKEKPPVDVILLDADLPVDGHPDAMCALKQLHHEKDIPLLVMTDRPGAQAYETALAIEASDFIRKPIQADELLGRLHAVCELKRQLDQCREHSSELERLNKELQRLAVMDELTAIANRRFFNLLLAQEWARAVREVVPISLIMIDIDHFKAYNDHYGHQKGDECLRLVASALTSVAKRPGDYVARYGGEEFTVILSHTGMPGALAVAEALRARVEALNLEHPSTMAQAPVTISLGVASTVPDRLGSPESLVAAADQAIYEAKRGGRNQVRAYPGSCSQIHAAHSQPRPPLAQRSN